MAVVYSEILVDELQYTTDPNSSLFQNALIPNNHKEV